MICSLRIRPFSIRFLHFFVGSLFVAIVKPRITPRHRFMVSLHLRCPSCLQKMFGVSSPCPRMQNNFFKLTLFEASLDFLPKRPFSGQ